MKESKGGSTKKAAKQSSRARASTRDAKNASPAGAIEAPPANKGAEKKNAANKPGSSEHTTGTSTASAAHTPTVDQQPRLPATHGKVGVFGGPKDRGIKPEDKLALPTGPHGVYERVRSLNPKSFYCAMRWNYHVEHLTPEEVKRWWANKKLLVTNAKNGSAVIVRAVDYGPHENTGLDMSISPGAAEALEIEIGDEVDIALADPKSPLGPQ
jgi:hypothetical protein